MSAALEVRGDVYADDMIAGIRRLAQVTKKTAAEIVREQSSTMARYLAEGTMPVAGINTGNPNGGGQAAKKMGEAATARDIMKVYAEPGYILKSLKNGALEPQGEKVNAKWVRSEIVAAQMSGDAERAQFALRFIPEFRHSKIIMFDGGKLHREKRKNGAVKKQGDKALVLNPKQLKEYIKAKQKLVGFTKAAWINAGRQVNPAGKFTAVNVWIKRHMNAPANGIFQRFFEFAEARLTSAVPWAEFKIDDRRAMESFDRNMMKSINDALAKLAAKEQAKKR